MCPITGIFVTHREQVFHKDRAEAVRELLQDRYRQYTFKTHDRGTDVIVFTDEEVPTLLHAEMVANVTIFDAGYLKALKNHSA
jgi:hypothetical protein